MPTYGDWIQEDDYVADIGPVNWASVTNTAVIASITEAGGIAPADPALVDQAIQDAVTDPLSGTVGLGGPGSVGGTVTADVNFTGGASGPFSTVYRASRITPPFAYSAHLFGTNQFSVTVPPDAIGVEYEGYSGGGLVYSTVISASLDLLLRNLSIDDTVTPAVAVTGSWSTDIKAVESADFGATKDVLTGWDGNVHGVGGTTVLSMGAASDPTATSYVAIPTDVTPYLYGDPIDGFLALVAEVSVGAITLADYSNDESGVAFGGQMSGSVMHYTLRPPRYRFIYAATRRRIAHNRGVQRGSDGQGVTGGKRGLQRTSRQSSLRGGSFY